ncbi:hypothetical protein VKT23_001990 [Stygiomarasmius scandens]|uniref:GmrSD restriction endonucleases N-terminal domain-containing protein n=1 Tax=Marasmiellus scandens TaxID=2682957 RepID=A0ABR1K6R6_9AGAR
MSGSATVFQKLPNRPQAQVNGNGTSYIQAPVVVQHDEGSDHSSDEDDDSDFSVDDILPQPHAYTRTTRELHADIHHGLIELNPAWQRDVVWGPQKQSQLIESLLRNFYIPPVVFAVQQDEDGETLRVCVDGKQRLTSILQFLDGQLAFKDQWGQSWWYTIPEGSPSKAKRREVPRRWKRKFEKKQITCVEFSDLRIGQEREIFQRVQLGVPLTIAEKLAAIASPVATWINELDDRQMGAQNGLSDVIDIELKRGKNFQNMAQFVFCCHFVDEELFPSGRRFEDFLNQRQEMTMDMKKQLEKALQQFKKLASNPKLNSGFTKIKSRVAPVEFVFIGVLLFLMEDASEKDQADAVYSLRKGIRTQFPDLRMRNDVADVMWAFVKSLQNDPTEVCHVDSRRLKRKRKSSGRGHRDGSDGEYTPSASRSKKPRRSN